MKDHFGNDEMEKEKAGTFCRGILNFYRGMYTYPESDFGGLFGGESLDPKPYSKTAKSSTSTGGISFIDLL
jgi:hypothetical protein